MTYILGQRPPVMICRDCGCDDNNACPGGCSWVLIDIPHPARPLLTGVCSSCAFDVRWDMRAMATMQFALEDDPRLVAAG